MIDESVAEYLAGVIQDLENTLKFYADEDNYIRDSEGESNIDIDNGHRAQQTLK